MLDPIVSESSCISASVGSIDCELLVTSAGASIPNAEPRAFAVRCRGMNDNLPRDQKPAEGLQGEDRRQGKLRDTRGGPYDVTPRSGQHEQIQERPTPHEKAQWGADVRPEPVVVEEDDLPEGLKRERKGPLNPGSGRRGSSDR